MADIPRALVEPPLPLRDWQQAAGTAALRWWQEDPPPWAVIHAVMGAGKTHLTGLLAETWRRALGPREHVVIVVPTRSLVVQTAEALRKTWCGPRVSRFYAADKDIGQVAVTTYDSAANLAGQLEAGRHSCAFVIADECHQTQNPRGHAALKALSSPRVIGLSATPYRSKRSETLELFDRALYKYGPSDALRDGIIVPFEVIPAEQEFTSDHADDVCAAMVHQAVKRGPTVVNAVSIEDAEAFAKRLQGEGIKAAAVHSKLAGTVAERGTPLGRKVHHLQTGHLQALVYPTLLSEGVDMPWLRCIVARRRIGSRVRFAQELGRALRKCDGKDRAYLYDPHDLCNTLSIDYEAALGWQEPDPESELHAALDTEDDADRAERARKAGEWFAEIPPAKKLDVATAFVRRLANAWRQTGSLRRMSSAPWRTAEPTPKHVAALNRMAPHAMRRHAASPYATLMNEAIERAGQGLMDRGTTTDLLEILGIVHRRPDLWPWEPSCD